MTVPDAAAVRQLEEQLARARELLQRHILEREEAEEALRESEERYRALIARAAYGIFLAASDGRFIEVNPSLVEMLGYDDADELRPANVWRDVFHDAAEGARVRDQAASDALPSWIETHWRRKGGAPLTARVALRAVRGAGGGIAHFEGMAEDITDRRRQEELLRRSERMASLGSTIAGIAHELNNPLAAIMGFAQILLLRPLSDDDRASVQTINEEAGRTARIVKDLLLLLRKREQEHRAPVDLNEVVGYIVRTHPPGEERPTLALELAAALPPVMGDRSQLEQVVGHLIDNAEKAARDGARAPRVVVRTRVASQEVMLEVEDSGNGIPMDALPRIWDPFWTTRGEGRGPGLGLSVVQSLVTQHGGIVEGHNTAGGGACFTVRFPVHPDDGDQSVAIG